MHLIVCSRAKQPIEEQIVDLDGQPTKAVMTLPWEPIQDKRLKYEMTIVLPMTLDGAYETDPARLKVPDDLAPLFAGALLTETTGAAIAEWVRGGDPVDHAVELFRRQAFAVANRGTAAFTKWWNSTAVKPRRPQLRPDLDNLASVARAADAEAAREHAAQKELRQREADQVTLDQPFGAGLPLQRRRAYRRPTGLPSGRATPPLSDAHPVGLL